MIRGTKRKFEHHVKNRGISFNASIHNKFEVEVVDSVTSKVKQNAVAYNVICNTLWNSTYLGGFENWFSYIAYGGGSGTPSSADTTLFSKIGVGQLTDPVFTCDPATGVASVRKMYQLPSGDAVGKVITEVGISGVGTGATILTHATLQDMNGNPISIEKTDTDVINFYATVFIHFNANGYNGVYVQDLRHYGTASYTFLSHLAGTHGFASNKGSYYMFFSSVLDNMEYTNGINYSGIPRASSNTANRVDVTKTYDSANRTLKLTASRLEANQQNYGGILHVMLCMYETGRNSEVPWLDLYLGLDDSSWYPGSTIENEAVGTGDGVTTDFALDFPFPTEVEVLVDGEPVQNFSITPYRTVLSDYNNAYNYMIPLNPYAIEDGVAVPYPVPIISTRCTGYTSAVLNGVGQYFFNRCYGEGLGTITPYNYSTVSPSNPPLIIRASNDLNQWVELTSSAVSGRAFSIPEEYQHYKYWNIRKTGSNVMRDLYLKSATFAGSFDGKHIRFSEPPAEGSVITASYKTPCIAKDEDHIFDLELSIKINDYTEAQ